MRLYSWLPCRWLRGTNVLTQFRFFCILSSDPKSDQFQFTWNWSDFGSEISPLSSLKNIWDACNATAAWAWKGATIVIVQIKHILSMCYKGTKAMGWEAHSRGRTWRALGIHSRYTPVHQMALSNKRFDANHSPPFSFFRPEIRAGQFWKLFGTYAMQRQAGHGTG